ncbi:MAG: portal protein, partial [Rhodospirillales bacterium]
FLCFRWLKAPGEVYGRSPIMKALPDIKTANKVVELVLKNASIAVTGIWQADDDGVLNPANVKLTPGTIIPKAVGSAGLTPLEAPGRFDVSNLVLEDLRGRIRHALLADRLGQIDAPKMTATEVMERSAEMSRVLGATYGRLQTELLTPLVARALAILRRRGEIPPVLVDGKIVELQYKSPLARVQAQDDVRNAMLWVQQATALGPEGQAVIDGAAAARWMARALSVPADLVRPPQPEQALLQNAQGLLLQALGQPAPAQ